MELQTTVPALTGMTFNEVKQELFKAGLSADIEEEGEVVERQMPPAGFTYMSQKRHQACGQLSDLKPLPARPESQFPLPEGLP